MSQLKLSPRWQRRKEARPSELIAAALELFVERGYAATRLEDVAMRAGVSKGTLYLYFDSKAELFKAVVQEGIISVIAEGEELLKTSSYPPEQLLKEFLHRWWQQIGTTHWAGIPKLVIAEACNFPEIAQYYHTHVIARGLKLLESALELGIEQRVFRPLNVHHLAQILIFPLLMFSVCKTSCISYMPEVNDSNAYLDTYFEFILSGLLTVPQGDMS